MVFLRSIIHLTVLGYFFSFSESEASQASSRKKAKLDNSVLNNAEEAELLAAKAAAEGTDAEGEVDQGGDVEEEQRSVEGDEVDNDENGGDEANLGKGDKNILGELSE
jgi:hypothetical protein